MKKVKGLIIAIICISLVVGLYYYVVSSRGKQSVESKKDLTEVEKVLTKDLEKNYPMTPREVITFYNRILGCLYNEEYTQEQFEGLEKQMRLLMDEELLEENPEEVFTDNLKKDVTEYQSSEKKIATTSVSDSADVQFKKVGGRECAYVSSSYFIRAGETGFSKTLQRFVLRKDKAENWKILAFKLVEGDSSDE